MGYKHTEEQTRKMLETRRKNGSYFHTPETRKKISQSSLGKKKKPFTEEHKLRIKLSNARTGKPAWNRGKKFSKESIEKMRLAHLGHKGSEKQRETIRARRGELHQRYIKDRTQLVKSEKKHLDGRYREWMLAIKNRDNWKCKISNKDCKGRLESHHILNWVDYPELRYELNNGITLCHFHHPKKWEEEINLSPYFKSLVMNVK